MAVDAQDGEKMKVVTTTAYDLAERFLGQKEIVGPKHNPLIGWMTSRLLPGVEDDETPWCGSFAETIAWMLHLPRPKSASARAWLAVGTPIDPRDAYRGMCVAILKRGGGSQPGPEVLKAPGHVGFFNRFDSAGDIVLLGGNQGNAVSVATFPRSRLLGIREL